MSLLLRHISTGAAYTLDSSPGSYVITGSASSLSSQHALNAIVGGYSITGNSATLIAQQAATSPAGKIKKRLDLTQYNQYVLRKMLEDEVEEIAEEREVVVEKPSNIARLGVFEPIATIEAAMPRVIDTLVSQGAEDAIPLLRAVYGEMLEKAKTEAIELEDIEILLLAA